MRRFLLIEQNMKGSSPPWWVTFHDTAADAATYHQDQEYPGDFDTEAITDLDSDHG